MRLKRLAILLPVVAIFTVSCTPDQIAWWENLDPATRNQLVQGPNDCHAQVDRQWPANSRAWAHRIVNRESSGIATAQNRVSTAAGCFQLLRMHAWRYEAVGYSWADRYNARANVKAALHLYSQSGTRPWS